MNVALAQQRLLNQRIEGEQFQQPEEVVRWMGAMQAQDYQQAVWAIGLRLRSATVATIEQALADGKILRTWPMRGTLHFVPPEDAKWMLSLAARRVLGGDKRRLEQLELDEAIIERATQLLHDALQGGKRLTRSDAMKLWEEAGIRTTGQRGYHLLWSIAQTGLICLGPLEDKQQAFVLLDEWAPVSRKFSHEEALAELARRYFTSHGPATVQDFAWWAGLTLTDARAGLEGAKAWLLAEKSDGQVYWLASDTSGQPAPTPSGVYLLPGFDEYLLGYKDRGAALAPEHAQKIVPGNNGVFLPMVVAAGQVVGTWKRTQRKNSLDILLSPFTALDGLEERAGEAAKRYSSFMEVPLSSTTLIR